MVGFLSFGMSTKHVTFESSPQIQELKMAIHKSNDLPPGQLWNKKERRLWIGSLFASCVMVYACRTVFPLTSPMMSKELGWTKTESGTALSAFFWGYAMTQVLGGYLGDKIGGDTVILTAAVGWSILTFWTPRIVYVFSDKATALQFIVFSRVLVGAFQGVHYPGVTSVIAKKVAIEERGFSYASATSGGHLGTLFCGSIGSLLLEAYGWHIPFYFTGMLGMAWLLAFRYYVVAKQRRKAQILSLKENITSSSTSSESTSVPWLTLFKHMSFWAIIIAHFCANFSYFILLSWLPTYFHEKFPEAKPMIFNVLPWMLRFTSVLTAGYFGDRFIKKGFSVTFVRKILNTVALIGQAFFLLLISRMSSFEGALFCMALAMACGGFHNSAVLVNPQDIAPQYAGSVFGLMNTAGAIPGFVGVYIAGHILELTNDWGAVFSSAAVTCIIGWLIFTLFGTGKKIV